MNKTKASKLIYEISERLADEPDYEDKIAPALEALANYITLENRGEELID